MGIRTVQRYETQFGLPVHRPDAMKRGSVFAFCHEIDDWMSKAPTRAEMNEPVRPYKSPQELVAGRRPSLAVAVKAKHAEKYRKLPINPACGKRSASNRCWNE